MTQLVVEVDTGAAAGLLDDLYANLQQPRPLLEIAADQIRDYETQVFRTGGFGQWPALEADYARRKHGGRILVDDGGLLRSLTRYPAPHAVQEISRDSVLVASDDVAAIMHQHGRHGPERNPAPAPSARYVKKWAEALLGALVDQTGR